MPRARSRIALTGATLLSLGQVLAACVFVPDEGSSSDPLGSVSSAAAPEPCLEELIAYEVSLEILEERQCQSVADPSPHNIDEVAYWFSKNGNDGRAWDACCDLNPGSEYCPAEPEEPDPTCSAPDAGYDAAGGAGDAGVPDDAGPDAGDAGVPDDAGSDAGDAGVPDDAGGGADAA